MNKKFYLLGLCVAASATVANAQQLPNVGFEEWKAGEDMGSTKYMGLSSGTERRPYDTQTGVTEPSDWNGSNVNQLGQIGYFIEKEIVSDNNVAVRLVNKFVGLSASLGSNAPGFITFGTPWVYAMFPVSNSDGGVFGGVEFSYKPDAIKGRYKYTQGNAPETSHIIVYLWNGTFSSNIGRGEACDDVDRAILGKSNAGTVSGDGKLVASCDYEITTTNGDWMDIVVPLEYKEGAGEPTKMNVIISAADYWTRSNIKENTTLAADDVDFVYYSTLTALKVNGETVELEEGKYEYSMTGSVLPTEKQVVATTKSQFAKAAVTVDAENAQVRIVVTNQDGKDVDGETLHTYVLQYEKAEIESTPYAGYLNIEMGGSNIAENQAATIEITETGEGKCTFVLPDLTLANLNNMYLGDIEVSDVTVTVDDNETKTYAGSVKGLSLAEGTIGADVELNGTIDVNGICDFKIDVLWNSMMGQPMESPMPINVTFTTNEIPAGVEGINGDAVTVYGVAGAVAVSGCNGTVNVYAADGRLVKSVMVDGNAEISLNGGLYIVRAGSEAYKVFVK